jgi:hypothetical protein
MIPAASGKTRAESRVWVVWRQGLDMKFWIVFLVLMSVWFIGVVSSNTYDGYIHIFAVFAFVSLAVWLFQRWRAS